MNSEPAPERPVDAESITSLRGEGPRVVRLSRKAIGIASAVGLSLVGAALLYALQPASQGSEEELFNTDGVAVADGLASAPRDYSQVPRLGPPLPGDLGKPILDAQERGAVAALPPVGAQPPPPPPQGISPEEAARQRIEQEREAARGSRLFFGGGTSAASLAQALSPSAPVPAPAQASVSAAQPAFLDRPAERRTVSLQRLDAAPTGALLQAGSVIPAALITGIRSDQPGLVTAQVTENVYDSLTGRRLLIPQGARLIGEYESDVGFGQRRVLLAWNRLILPDGRSIVLERQPAADPSGYAGLEDGVDYHWGGVLKAALVSTLLGVGSDLGSGSDSDLARALRRGSQDSVNRTGEQIVSRELNIRPTLTIRPGYPVRVLVTRDIVLESAS
ncbi:MAG: conjugal transfer protein TraI [Rhodobacterales bacterium CG15_BIG_FIL_POST_REV_8_21_14_020_59_13]|nr:TrbI/VirB10 family protein [Sphingomonadales bacterium]PIW27752.1 MAG: conjugal transfer protein TraI [Rhodobacterales bacterium CG15_BIG_FIL_POST_REV_8_21_14_020_59_13]NCP25869.1 TrbI/VirB10 family protein [Sphingomonadales bacterium]NCP49168.1 TrbI/VirB10 family protein [Sphingomonadales bacterium]NCQ20128.1 TrbI/VirB10 family protein [Sphingomonadales bacterium]